MDGPTPEKFEAMQPEHAGCPYAAAHQPAIALAGDDELVLPKHKSVITQYSTDASGATVLHLYYGEKEICFDEPDLFAFGETLGQQARFVAGVATTWGSGYPWSRVQELLAQLIEEGVLQRADSEQVATACAFVHSEGMSLSPLPPAYSTEPRSWFDCEAITLELTGHAVELGYLELIVPIFRIAHIALDAEGRQVGEANVFPRSLRLDIPTEWRTCLHAGSRHQANRPMNIAALKSMRKHWTSMMAVLLRIRAAFLRRFPGCADGWTVGSLERLSSLVLAVPAYVLMRKQQRVENGHLHPVLSSTFRVTDGVRMTMHQMLFLAQAEPTLPPDTPMTSSETYAYAERNYVFFSELGVCAGPKAMIEEFLAVLVDGKSAPGTDSVTLDGPVEAALEGLDAALDYGLYGLQAHAVVFSLWPMMSRAYEQLWATLEAWPGTPSDGLLAFRARFERNIEFLRNNSLLGTEALRASRERVYADMYAQCAVGLELGLAPSCTLSERIAPVFTAHHALVADQLRAVLQHRWGASATTGNPSIECFVNNVLEYLCREQAIVRVACEIQQRINNLLERAAPTRPLAASAIDVYNQLHGQITRLPYLVGELEEALGLRVVVTQDHIEITDLEAVSENKVIRHQEIGQHGVGQSTCDGHG